MLRRNRNDSRGRNDPVESRTNEKDEEAHVRQIVLYAGCDRSDRVVFQWAVLQRSLSQICRCLCLPSPSRNPDDSQSMRKMDKPTKWCCSVSTRRTKQMRFDERNGILRQHTDKAAGSGCPRVGELLAWHTYTSMKTRLRRGYVGPAPAAGGNRCLCILERSSSRSICAQMNIAGAAIAG
jgi:hypothetical protein